MIRKTDEKMSPELVQAYETWISYHSKVSKGDRKHRLSTGLGHAETMFIQFVWWPAFGNLSALFPEYEVRDFKDGWRYLDFAFITEGLRICIEIDGYGSHWRDTGRSQFSDHLMRQKHLIIDGWLVIRFSYDDVFEKPRRCQQILQQLLGKWSGVSNKVAISPIEQTILNLAYKSIEPLTPHSAASIIGIHRKTAAKYLRCLVEKQLMLPLQTGTKRIVRYKVKTQSYPS